MKKTTLLILFFSVCCYSQCAWHFLQCNSNCTNTYKYYDSLRNVNYYVPSSVTIIDTLPMRLYVRRMGFDCSTLEFCYESQQIDSVIMMNESQNGSDTAKADSIRGDSSFPLYIIKFDRQIKLQNGENRIKTIIFAHFPHNNGVNGNDTINFTITLDTTGVYNSQYNQDYYSCMSSVKNEYKQRFSSKSKVSHSINLLGQQIPFAKNRNKRKSIFQKQL